MYKLSSINKTYYSIICEAIENSPNKELYVGEIYEYIYNKYSKYLINNWKNSVRHALCLKEYFINNKINNKKKCGTWSLDKNYKNEIELKRRIKFKKDINQLEIVKTNFNKNIQYFKKKYIDTDKLFLANI
jgi:hypothetical protein